MKTTSNQYMRWLNDHKKGVSGMICIAVAVVLLVSLVSFGWSVCVASVGAVFLAVYAFVRGAFTIVFDLKENNLGEPVYQRVLIDLYNQLFFVYEKMLWVWALLPIIVIGCLLFIEDLVARKWIVVVIGSISIVLIAVFSKQLIRKRRYLCKRIKDIEKDLVKTNASS